MGTISPTINIIIHLPLIILSIYKMHYSQLLSPLPWFSLFIGLAIWNIVLLSQSNLPVVVLTYWVCEIICCLGLLTPEKSND
jgi:hypothetical protein